MCRAALLGLLAVALGCEPLARAAASVAEVSRSAKRPRIDFGREIKPLLAEYCYGCHGEKKKGGLDFRIYSDERSALKDRRVFEKVLGKLEAHEMPPENKPQPTAAERGLITNWVGLCFFQCDCNHPDPGRVTIRRLNRAEYNNTIRELIGVDFQPAEDFPADDSGYGFDNIGDVLSLSPVLMEKYLAAAERVLNAVLPSGSATNGAPTGAVVPTNAAYRRIMMGQPTSSAKPECARQIITNFATRAFRRPVTSGEQQRLMELFSSAGAGGEGFDNCIKLVFEAVLVSPQFLFRGEAQPEPNNAQAVRPLDEYALASRLSYFLWSSMPDEELFAQAAHRALRRNLEA